MSTPEKRYFDLQRKVLEARFDADETYFLERELTQLRAKIIEVQYPMLLARTFAPKATDIAPSADTYSYKVALEVGKADHRGYRAKDHPKVDVKTKEITGKVRPITASYDWDLNELREAARLGLPLGDAKARAARNIIERGIDETLAFGSILDSAGAPPDDLCYGIVNHPWVKDLSGTGSSRVHNGKFWTNPTPMEPSEILADLNDWWNSVAQESKQAFQPDSMILPKTHYDKIATTPFSELSGESILSVFLKNQPACKNVTPWYLLDLVPSAAGGADKPRGIIYQKDPMVLEAIIPQEFEALPPQADNFLFEVLCHARSGGMKIHQPLGMRYADFATS